ncbi:hypothetical protein DFA_12106 [Cavenderia fasciculata]|uniref:N-acetyltransferase domain-containing protein n=1 Tax=Cavenderia fasciculata TaxID=261658 RepID=F4QFT9_CACFS|nr:uncharacterized protein DFA_12106 [Cavenderia fasciculata]EGG14336.1 hypothetical protein DFA_12106 [Cavenderia fasciculata]|eukprot:XP_004351045.1 hypothetical protein DFA_12106 [Cavenderia fasciculata]
MDSPHANNDNNTNVIETITTKKGTKIYIKTLDLVHVERAALVVNLAYRGPNFEGNKQPQQQQQEEDDECLVDGADESSRTTTTTTKKKVWTNEEAFFSNGKRIDEDGLKKEIRWQSDNPLLKHIFVAEMMINKQQQDGTYKEMLEVVGTIKLERDQVKDSEGGMGLLSVDPAYQSHGIGRELIHFVERYSKEHWSLHKIVIYVVSLRTELIAWYDSLGYHSTNLYVPYHNPDFSSLQRFDLQFIQMEKIL